MRIIFDQSGKRYTAIEAGEVIQSSSDLDTLLDLLEIAGKRLTTQAKLSPAQQKEAQDFIDSLGLQSNNLTPAQQKEIQEFIVSLGLT